MCHATGDISKVYARMRTVPRTPKLLIPNYSGFRKKTLNS